MLTFNGQLIGDSVQFDTAEFPADWRVPDDCDGELLVAGLSPQGGELYYLVDFGRRQLKRLEVSVQGYAEKLTAYWRDRLDAQHLPYGMREFTQVPPNFLQPHEGLRLANGTIAMAMHNCGYIRLIRFDDAEVGNFPGDGWFEPTMYSATNSVSADTGRLYFAEWSLDDRLRRYSDKEHRFECRVKSLDETLQDERTHGVLEVDECLHEVKIAPDGRHIILTEFCLVTPVKPPSNAPDIFERYEAWREFEDGGLFASHLHMLDADSGIAYSTTPRGWTPGHVEFSRHRPNDFYLSCHNLSKANGRVILHGQGALIRYQLADGRVQECGRYETVDSWRLTSHVVFTYRGRNYLAVTVYPNRLVIFDDETFEVLRDVELFPMDSPAPNRLHFSQLGRRIPIWLAASNNERYLILASNSYLYLYDFESDRVVELSDYCFAGELIGTAHISNVSPGYPAIPV